MRQRLIDLVWMLYVRMQPIVPNERVPLPWHREGKFCRFEKRGGSCEGYPSYVVFSQRGSIALARIEWSPQWRAYSMVSAGNGVSDIVRWNAQSVAEVYAFLKELGTSTGRFV